MEKFEVTFKNKKTGNKHTEMINHAASIQEAALTAQRWINDVLGNPDLKDCEIIKISKDWI